MQNKKIDLVIGVLFIATLSIGVAAQSASTGTVAATVTVQNVSVSVTDGTVTYGTRSAGYVTSTLATAGLNDQQSAVNNGNVTENFNIKGQNSANWTLNSSTSTDDNYTHKFSTSSSFSAASSTALTTSYATLAIGVAAVGTTTFDLQIHLPGVSTNYTAQSVDVTVQATAN